MMMEPSTSREAEEKVYQEEEEEEEKLPWLDGKKPVPSDEQQATSQPHQLSQPLPKWLKEKKNHSNNHDDEEDEEANENTTTASSPLDVIRKTGVAVAGGTMVGVGLVMIPLPTPFGAVIAGSGMAVLGTEFPAAQRVLKNTCDSVADTIEHHILPPPPSPPPSTTKPQFDNDDNQRHMAGDDDDSHQGDEKSQTDASKCPSSNNTTTTLEPELSSSLAEQSTTVAPKQQSPPPSASSEIPNQFDNSTATAADDNDDDSFSREVHSNEKMKEHMRQLYQQKQLREAQGTFSARDTLRSIGHKAVPIIRQIGRGVDRDEFSRQVQKASQSTQSAFGNAWSSLVNGISSPMKSKNQNDTQQQECRVDDGTFTGDSTNKNATISVPKSNDSGGATGKRDSVE